MRAADGRTPVAAVRAVDDRLREAVDRLHVPPGLDRALVALSEAADHAKLWTAAAALLIGTGRQRAGVRGIDSLLVASALTNLVGKRLFGGPRPPGPATPARRVRDMPVSGSFPSGHSASAAAFVTGAALESPATLAVLAPLGALVAWSRIHVGAHWLSDVVGGIAIGIAVAVAGRILVPAGRGAR